MTAYRTIGRGRASAFTSSALLLFFLSACGTALPPPELVQARASYDRVSKGTAAELAPAELDTAKQALARAEASFEDNGADAVTRDLAYIAERRALLAEAQAGFVQAERERQEADKAFRKTQIQSLAKTQEQLEAERRAAEANRTALEAERKARAEAEKRAAAAMASLAEIAKVKEESRGVVITLSGAVLFATGKHELLPIAAQKLDEVAKAVMDQGFKAVIVEGHTDSRGNPQANEALSFRRAESVRSHLVSRGIPPEKITARGLGSSRPVADNSTAEGRANNRRVEIIVEPER
ncbi:MAG TPA: OmpA family protein [Polyangiaceae bacterium]|nr:OmpA family protein [Polyangiaceae bacterium]